MMGSAGRSSWGTPCNRLSCVGRRAFSLIELLAAIFIVGILAGILLPGMQSARDAARRTSCANNLRQIGIALNGHAELHNVFPVGAQGATTMGVSWWPSILPYLDEATLLDRLDLQSGNAGFIHLHPQNARAIASLLIPTMMCPASSLEPFKQVGGILSMMPSYVGISGATNEDGFPELRVNACCLPKVDGQISGGGLLIPNVAVRPRMVTDGLSHTMTVGECSEPMIDPQGKKVRVDGAYPFSWISGTSAVGTPPNYHPAFSPPNWNITTIRYAPNMREYGAPGVYNSRGANNPLLSAHSGGVQIAIADGSVQFLADEIDLRILKCLATRDDGFVSSR